MWRAQSVTQTSACCWDSSTGPSAAPFLSHVYVFLMEMTRHARLGPYERLDLIRRFWSWPCTEMAYSTRHSCHGFSAFGLRSYPYTHACCAGWDASHRILWVCEHVIASVRWYCTNIGNFRNPDIRFKKMIHLVEITCNGVYSICSPPYFRPLALIRHWTDLHITKHFKTKPCTISSAY